MATRPRVEGFAMAMAGLLLIAGARSTAEAQEPALSRAELLRRFARAYYPGRTGQLAVVPRAGHIITKRGAATVFMHGSPWPYDSRIPFLLYGPRFVSSGVYTQPVSHQDMAPTLAELLGVPMPSTCSGRSQSVALKPGGAPPRLVLLLVVDGMRQDYFDRHAAAMPTLDRLRRQGAWFSGAEINYLPTITGLAHATIATGADPRVHGIVGNAWFDRVAGRAADAYPALSPRQLMVTTLADLWNLRTNGRAVIVGQGSAPRAAIPLAGHGSCLVNGRPVIALSYGTESGAWETSSECFRLPDYLKDQSARRLFEGDNATWMGHAVGTLDAIRGTALFSSFETGALKLLIEHEPFGADDVSDLVMVNLKTPDYVGHRYGPDSPELQATLGALDRDIASVLAAVEAKVGRDGFVLALTADHGMPPEPDPARGQLRVYTDDIVSLVHAKLDPQAGALVKHYEPENMQLAIDTDRLRGLHLELGAIRTLLEAQPYVLAVFTDDELARASSRLDR
jgi:hypothetical protein